MSATTIDDEVRKLKDEIALRERGRISLLNALSAVAEQSTSHSDAVRIAREQLRAAGCFTRDNPHVAFDGLGGVQAPS